MTGHADPVRREPHDVRETTAATRPRVAPAAHGSELQRGLKPQEILALQRTAGNAAVGHLLRRQTPTAAGRPPLRRPASASVHRQSMDAGVVTRPSHPAVPAPPEPSRVSCPVSAVNWLDHAERTAARLAETSSAVAPLEHMRLPPAPTYLSESDGDPSLLAAWGALAQVVEQVSATWVEAAPLVSEYLAAANNESIPGGAGVTLSQVSRPDGAAVAPSPDARRALFGDADFEGAAHQMYAAQDTIERHVQEAHAAAIDLTAAERAIEHAVAEQRLHGAHDEQADAQGRRAAAQEGRANELQNIQNAIRVLELGVGLLAGGVAARAAGSGATGPASVRQAAGTATTAAVAGIGSNSLHDLAVGFVAERFVSERWSQQIEEASRTIDAAAARAHTAIGDADRAAIARAQAQSAAARARIRAADQAISAAQFAYSAALLRTAAAAGAAVPGRQGDVMQASVAALVPIQGRIDRLRRLEETLVVPSYSPQTGVGYTLWDSPASEGMPWHPTDFQARLARVIFFARTFVPRERARWQQRYQALSTRLETLAPREP